ncbi:DoxX family protein [Sphingobacterium sp. BIGb0165]|uniref:DoxX family protein n=1 Tax=Sphingobacterium sp. BIGb0165 TaxID=2940615 RepID=UPI00216991EE|nr:DoxX family membrane protein [Sphingobacterium sp. BIGb0165]MCS4229161.1 putative membrane protein YphA (DoxX/SURF4 family) [Sphingobacterium sp. BIGb0165]
MYSQLFVRLAVATAFLSAVADRLGFWGAPGTSNASWGNWANFVAYSNQLNFFAPASMSNVLAIGATVLEVVLGILLLIGYRTRLVALFSGGLLTIFALTMMLSFGIKVTFNYSVWVGASACFLLGTNRIFPFSLDHYLERHRRK